MRLIDANAIVYDFGEIDDGLCKRTEFYVTDDAVAKQPTIDAEPVRHGKWRQTYLDHEAFGERPSIFYCSACCACSSVKTNYCPNCGADMRGEE